MKKIFLSAAALLILFCAPLRAQISQDFLLDSAAVAAAGPDEDAIAGAEESARRLLQQKPRALRKQTFPKLRSKPAAAEKPLAPRNQSAPFGLVWGSTMAETGNQGIILSPIEEKDYLNSFSATHLPKAVKDFARVDITFGEEDELWRIIAYGKRLDDTPAAADVLQMYKIYSALLNTKYGNKQEFFTPAQVDVIKQDANGKDITVQEPAPLGNPDFLKQLQSGDAVLYSTYHNNEVGAALAVNVDGDGKSYIVVDYKNLQILQAREKQTLDAL